MLLGSTPFTYAQVTTVTFGPQLVVTTIPQDDQVRNTGLMILGLTSEYPGITTCTTDPTKVNDPYYGSLHGPATSEVQVGNTLWIKWQLFWSIDTGDTGQLSIQFPLYDPTKATVPPCAAQDLMSEHKLLVTYNGQTVRWQLGATGSGVPVVSCKVFEKDKINVVPDVKTQKGKQFDQENLMTKLVDVSDKFICKPRWKSPSPGIQESAGVLDVYYTGPFDANWIADNILLVEVSLPIGRSLVFGADIQDICLLGGAYDWNTHEIFKPEFYTVTDQQFWYGIQVPGVHFIYENPLGPYAGCEGLALLERDYFGIQLATGQDPLAAPAA